MLMEDKDGKIIANIKIKDGMGREHDSDAHFKPIIAPHKEPESPEEQEAQYQEDAQARLLGQAVRPPPPTAGKPIIPEEGFCYDYWNERTDCWFRLVFVASVSTIKKYITAGRKQPKLQDKDLNWLLIPHSMDTKHNKTLFRKINRELKRLGEPENVKSCSQESVRKMGLVPLI